LNEPKREPQIYYSNFISALTDLHNLKKKYLKNPHNRHWWSFEFRILHWGSTLDINEMTGLWYKKISQRSGIMVTGAIYSPRLKKGTSYTTVLPLTKKRKKYYRIANILT